MWIVHLIQGLVNGAVGIMVACGSKKTDHKAIRIMDLIIFAANIACAIWNFMWAADEYSTEKEQNKVESEKDKEYIS
jgi:hypothetical protein